jgi:hypothetical protein
MKNLITYLMNMNVEDKMNMRLDMLARDGSPGHTHMINYCIKYRNEIFQYAIIKSDAKLSSIEELTTLHLHSYLGMRGYIKGIKAMSAEERIAASEKGYENGLRSMPAEERMAASEKGYENGLGSMSAEERIAVSEKGYENGLGAMSAKERMAASKKGYENGLGSMSAEENTMRMGIVWEEKYAEFKRCVGMPEIGTSLYNWQRQQLGNTHASCLNAKIRKEHAENKGRNRWSDWRVKLSDCIEQKNRVKMGIAWEEKYTEFESYDRMPERGTTLYNWQRQQLGNGDGSLNAKIQEEIEENEGSEWSERRVKLSDCVEQKNRVKMGIAWEEKYAEFESYDGMPEKGTPLYNWQMNQLSNGHASCLNAKIRKEYAENKGSIWRERRVKLSLIVWNKRGVNRRINN